MGRRRRKRSAEPAPGGRPPLAPRADAGGPGDEAGASPAGAPTPPPRAAARRPPAPPTRRARLEDAPPAPWSPFPLVELTILFGIVLIVLGFVGVADRRALLLVCGFALVTLASLELSLREHFSGYRSHSALLAGAAAVIVDVPLFFWTRLAQEILLAVGVAVFAASFFALRAAFRRRTGGIGFRV